MSSINNRIHCNALICPQRARILIGICIFLPVFSFGETFEKFDIGDGSYVTLPLAELSAQDELRLMEPNNEKFEYHSHNSLKKKSSLKNKMSPVRSQGNRGACPAFATIGLIEFYQGEDFSEQCLQKFSSDEDGGFAFRMFEWAMKNGLYLESDCPYDPRENGRDTIPDLSKAKVKSVEYSGYETRSQEAPDPITYIKDEIDEGGPITIAVFVAGKWNEGGIIQAPSDGEIRHDCGLDLPNGTPIGKKCKIHVVVATGYDDNSEYLEFKNSWGKKWPFLAENPDGYGKMSYGYFLKMRAGNHSMVSR